MSINLKTFRIEQLNKCIDHCQKLFPIPPNAFQISTLSNISHKDVIGLTKIVEALKKHMGIEFKTRVTITDVGPEHGGAWIHVDSYKPISNGKPNYDFVFEIGIRLKSLLGTREWVIMAIAHELSHLRLYSMDHVLKNSEIMTDIFCIFSGFGDLYFYLSKDEIKDPSKLGRKFFEGETEAYRKGESNYLTKFEKLYVFAKWKIYCFTDTFEAVKGIFGKSTN